MEKKFKEKNNILIKKLKYWYCDEIEVCVLCGKEKHNKHRVFNESEKGIRYKHYACFEHF